MFKHTDIHTDVVTVKTMLLKRNVRSSRVLRDDKRNNTVINAFDVKGTEALKHAHAGIFVDSIWSNKLWRESIFSSQL